MRSGGKEKLSKEQGRAINVWKTYFEIRVNIFDVLCTKGRTKTEALPHVQEAVQSLSKGLRDLIEKV